MTRFPSPEAERERVSVVSWTVAYVVFASGFELGAEEGNVEVLEVLEVVLPAAALSVVEVVPPAAELNEVVLVDVELPAAEPNEVVLVDVELVVVLTTGCGTSLFSNLLSSLLETTAP
jgi:hypothetical protein